MREFCKKKKKIIINIHEKKKSQGASPQNVLLIALVYGLYQLSIQSLTKLVKSCEVEVGVTLYETEIFSTLLWSPTMFRLLMTLPSGLSVVVRSMLIVAVLLLISSGAVDPGLKFSAVYGLIGCGLM